MPPQTTIIGKFKNNSGKMILTDPCNNYSISSSLHNVPVLKGVWEGRIITQDYKMWGNRVKDLIVCHESAITSGKCAELTLKLSNPLWKELPGAVGVDSGQAGIFDTQKYPKDFECDCDDEKSFYGKACNITMNKDAGIIDTKGIVSSSGYGDGCYSVFASYNDKKKIDMLRISFI